MASAILGQLADDVMARLAAVELLIIDVDGVLTDGSVVYTDRPGEIKRFHVRDGSGLKLWHAAGFASAIVSGRNSPAVDRRGAELGVRWVMQGCGDKLPALRRLLDESGVEAGKMAALGDDLPDLPLMRSVGLGIAPADACAEVLEFADVRTTSLGGHGVVREAVEAILKAKGLWRDLVEPYLTARLGDDRAAPLRG